MPYRGSDPATWGEDDWYRAEEIERQKEEDRKARKTMYFLYACAAALVLTLGYVGYTGKFIIKMV